jgi:hypothetical protein
MLEDAPQLGHAFVLWLSPLVMSGSVICRFDGRPGGPPAVRLFAQQWAPRAVRGAVQHAHVVCVIF